MVDESVAESVRLYGLSDVVTVISYVSHAEAIQHMRAASALLLVIEPFENAKGMITGKLYEYLASGRHVLGIGPVDGDAARLLTEVRAGAMCLQGDTDEVASNLKLQYSQWEKGETVRGASLADISAYTRRSQTGILAEHLDALVSSST